MTGRNWKSLGALAALGLAACSPALQGVCSSDADCKSDETCSNGICLSRSAPDANDVHGDGGDAGNTDGGDAGKGGDGGGVITLITPDGGFVAGTFQAVAQVSAAGTVTFDLEPVAGGSSLVNDTSAAAAGQLSKTLVVNDAGFNGSALLHATLHSGGQDSQSQNVPITVDQEGPQVSTAYDGTNRWAAADGGFTVAAAVSDKLSGVATATLSVLESSTVHLDYQAVIAGGVATFNVPAKDLAVASSPVLRTFGLSAKDNVGNLSALEPTSFTVFKIDDQAPVISGLAAVGGPWFQARVPVTAVVSDGAGSGVAPASLTLVAGSVTATGFYDAADGGRTTFNADFTPLTDGGFEGQIAFQVSARDNVGNAAVVSGSANIDTVPPAIGNVAPATAPDVTVNSAGWFGGDGGAIVLHADVDGGLGSPIDPASLSLDFDGGLPPNPNEPKTSFDLPRTAAAGVEGPRTFHVHAADQAGNQSTAAVTLNFDTVAPALVPASLHAPAGWVRRGAAGSAVPTVFSAPDKGVGTASVTLETPDGATVLANLSSGDGVLFAGNLPLAWTAPGIEGPATLKAVALDKLRNTATASYQILVDDVPPAIAIDGSNPANLAWHGAQAGTLSFTASASITDKGSGVSTASMMSAPGTPPAAGSAVWTFGLTLPSDPAIESDHYGPVTVTATDGTGNGTTDTASFFFKIDNKPPAISGLAVATAADGVVGSTNWYRGPNNAPPTATLDLTATITETYLDPANPPAATVVGSPPIPGRQDSATATLWHFAIPRAVGAGATGPVTVTLDAVDLANNHSAKPAISLNFDDAAPAAFAPSVNADTAWHQRTAGGAAVTLPVVATFGTLPASGIKSIVLGTIPPTSNTSNTYSFSLPATNAPAGVEQPYTVMLVTTSVVGVASSVAVTRYIDDVIPAIAADTSNAANQAWHGVQAGTLAFTASALITDNGSGVASATMMNAPGKPPTAGSSAWTFGLSLPTDATIESDRYGPVTVSATDGAGNTATDSSSFTFKVDNKPPAITGLAIATAADGVAGGTNWYRGPNNSPPTATLDLTATIVETYLDPSNPPAATVAGVAPVPGVQDSGTATLWHFPIPRTVGANASAPVTVTLDAVDLAKNHSSKPTISLNFDDVAPVAFTPSVNADTAWHPRTTAAGAAVNLPVTATFAKLPSSGIKSITLGGTGPTSNTATTYNFALASTNAPANVEKPYSVTLLTTSVVGQTVSVTVTRNIDDVPPATQAGTIKYSNAATGTPLAWGRTNSFNVRDSGTLYTFQAYDCGAGISPVVTNTGFGQATVAASGSTFPCANGAHADIYNYSITGNFGGGQFANVDNNVSLAATVSDAVAGTGSAALHTASAGSSVNVTRRYWQTGNLGVTSLALGPSVVVGSSGSGLVGLNSATGQGWSTPVSNSASAVGSFNGSPAVFTLAQSNTNSSVTGTLKVFDPANGAALGNCALTSAPPGSGTPSISSSDSGLALFTNGDAAMLVSAEIDWTATAGGDLYHARTYGLRSSPGCPLWLNSTSVNQYYGNVAVTNFVIGRSSWTYFGVGTGLGPDAPGLVAANANGAGPVTAGAACSGGDGLVATDNGGSDAVVCSGMAKWNFTGAGFSPGWKVAAIIGPQFLVTPATGTVLGAATSTATAGVSLVNGGQTVGSNPFVVWLADASPTPVVFDSLPNGVVEARSMNGSSFSGPLYALPAVSNVAVADMILDRSGILYVASGGQVSAMFTDSTAGLGTAGNGWPVRGHDACRSNNLEYACPY